MHWLWPPDNFFIARNLPKLQHVPLLVDNGAYPVEVNRYVEERSLGEWGPGMGSEDDDPPVLTKKSRANLATKLCALYFWLGQDKRRDWRTLDYPDLLKYQLGLQLGTGSASGRALKASSINGYVDEACAFLKWAAVRGLRCPFKVPTRRTLVERAGRGTHTRVNTRILVSARQGALQQPTNQLLVLPSAVEIERWMAVLRVKHPVKAIMFELMVRAGIRISEANLLRLGCFPRQTSWGDATTRGWVPLLLRFGVKGPKVVPGEDLSTKSRFVEVPIELAERIEHYIRWVRPNLIARYRRRHEAPKWTTDRLWIGENAFRPIAYSTLYKAWTTTQGCPTGWHPHKARHYYAVEKVVDATRCFLELNELQDKLTPGGFGWIHGLMAGQIRMILSPHLGHVEESTSQIYLSAAVARLAQGAGHPLVRWNQIIDLDLPMTDNE